MNTIRQDGAIIGGALACAPISPLPPASARMACGLDIAAIRPRHLAATRNSTHHQVGKNGCRSWQNFADWIQLAKGCQLNSPTNQLLGDFAVQLAVGSRQILPTDPSHCFASVSGLSEVGNNTPSYYVGEGPCGHSPLRRESDHPDDVLQVSRTVVLAIDLGTTTGWAMKSRDAQITHGVARFKPQRFEGGGMRYLRFKRWLTELRTLASEIHCVYFEEVRRHAGVDAAHVYGGLLATLTAWCEHHNIPYQGVPVGTIKRHATGKGNASKEEVIQAIRAKGHPVQDDNEADALALLHWVLDTQEA